MNITVIFLIILVILLLVILYMIYNKFSSKSLVNSQYNLSKGALTINNDYIQYPGNGSSSFSVWIYCNKKVSNITTIFQYNVLPGYKAYNTGYAVANICYALYIDGSNKLMFTNTTTTKYDILDSMPIQKWTNVFINVYNSLYFEFYINGKFVKSIKSDATAKPTSSSSVTIGGDTSSDNVTITQLVRWYYNLDSTKVWNNYLKGNGNMNSSFNADLVIKDSENVVIKDYKLFN